MVDIKRISYRKNLMSGSKHICGCLSFMICSEDDIDDLLNKFFALYTRSLLLECNTKWVSQASETIKYMNELRVLKEEEDTREGLRFLFNDND